MGVCGLGKAMLELKAMVVGWLMEGAGIETSTVYYYMWPECIRRVIPSVRENIRTTISLIRT